MPPVVSKYRDIGVAIAGTGFMGWVHAEALRRVGVRLVGVLGSTPTKSHQAADAYGAETGYASFAELLVDTRVQAVHIGTPNKLHFPMVTQALEAGKHVLCEKPLAMTSDESARLVELAARRPKQAAAVNYNIRFYPQCVEARERIARGDLGDLFHITGSYAQDWLIQPTDYNWRVLADQGGTLRAVSDIGTHWLDLVQTVTGRRIVAVCADLHTVHPTRYRPTGEVQTFAGATDGAAPTEPVAITTDDFGSVLLRFQGGARGCVWVSQVTAGRKNCLRMDIAGQNAALAWQSDQPNDLWIGRRDSANQQLIRDPALMTPAAAAACDYPGGHNEGYGDTFKQAFSAFYAYIQQGDFDAPPPFPTFAQGHREMLLCDAIAKSAAQRGWVDVPDVD